MALTTGTTSGTTVSSPTTWGDSAWAALRKPITRRIAGGGVLCAIILWFLNYRPGAIPSSAAFFTFAGQADCFAQQFPPSFSCALNGVPSGLTPAFGMPQIWLNALVHSATGMDLLNSYRLTYGLTIVIAFIGATRFFRFFVPQSWLRQVLAAVFLISPIVSAEAGYGPLQLGFALLPTYLLVDITFLRRLGRSGPGAIAGWAVLVIAVRVFALFTDPYSMVMSLIPVAVGYLIWAFRTWRQGLARVAVGLAVGAASVGVAYWLFSAYLGVSGFQPMPIDFFRGQGVDLYPLVVPSPNFWFADLLGIHHNLAPSQAYSDGPNIRFVYLGLGLVVAAVAGAVLLIRRRSLRNRATWAVIAGGIVGFVLALGPSLKIADFRSAQALLNGVPGVDLYMMKENEATLSTGLAWIYQSVPAINSMRALYRWELLARLALLVLAGIAISAMVRAARRYGRVRRGPIAPDRYRIARTRATWLRVGVAVFVGLIVVESLPSPIKVAATGETALAVVGTFDADVVVPLSEVVHPGERVIIINPDIAGSGGNHFLAVWMCPRLGVSCFNGGGDKADSEASKDRPALVNQVLRGSKTLKDDIENLFRQGLVNAVILVKFDLRGNSYYWPPTKAQETAANAATDVLLTGVSWSVNRLAWSTVVRPAP